MVKGVVCDRREKGYISKASGMGFDEAVAVATGLTPG
jgi:hypothetical protein